MLRIREEDWLLNSKDKENQMRRGKEPDSAVDWRANTAKLEAECNELLGQVRDLKRHHSPSPRSSDKRGRVRNPHLVCTNKECPSKIGHLRDTCFAYSGDRVGKYCTLHGGEVLTIYICHLGNERMAPALAPNL
jgi:hypothetical protein